MAQENLTSLTLGTVQVLIRAMYVVKKPSSRVGQCLDDAVLGFLHFTRLTL